MGPLEPLLRQPLRLDLLRKQVQALRTVRGSEPVLQEALIFKAFTTKHLATGQVRWHYSYVGYLKTALGLFYKSMKGIIARYRAVSVASIMLLLVGVVALSTATRRPCLQACSGPWHTYKAGHLTESEQHESPVTNAAESTELDVVKTKAPPPRYVPHEETLPVTLPITFSRHHFRSPPVLE
jgi:hypothetical protein